MSSGESSNGFILLPLAEQAREGKLAKWGDSLLAVLPVLIAHENHETRLAWPSLSRLAILAGLGKPAVRAGIASLQKGKWCAVDKRPKGGPAWKMLYEAYQHASLESRSWIRIAQAVISDGVWAAMPASAKRLYLVMRGLAVMGHQATGEWIEALLDEDGLEPYAYLPAAKMAPAALSELTGLPARTLHAARTWLLDNGMAEPTGADQMPGLILPFDPQRHAPKVLARLDELKAKSEARAQGAALRAYRAVKKAANSGARNSSELSADRPTQTLQSAAQGHATGKKKPRNRQRQPSQSAATDPELSLEPAFEPAF